MKLEKILVKQLKLNWSSKNYYKKLEEILIKRTMTKLYLEKKIEKI